MFRLLLSLALLLQVSPQIHWKSEVKQAPDGTNQLVLTGDLDPGIDHVTGTVTYMPCEGEACYLPVDWDFEQFFTAQRASGRGLGNVPELPVRNNGITLPFPVRRNQQRASGP